MGGSRAGPAVVDHARNGRVEPAVRVSQAGRARGRDGSHWNPDRDSRKSAVLLAAAVSATRCCFSIARRSRREAIACSISPGYKNGRDLFKREDIEAGTIRWSGRATWARPIEPHRPQDHHFRGNIVQAMVAVCRREVRPAPGAPERCVAHHRDRIRSHDERRPPGPPRRAASPTSIQTTSASAASTRRCSA
jgi:hypothetical protein